MKMKSNDPLIVQTERLLGCEMLVYEDGSGYFELKIFPNEFHKNPDVRKTITKILDGLKCMAGVE